MEQRKKFIEDFILKNQIIPPNMCICGNKKLSLQIFKNNKTDGFCFRCLKKACKKIYNIRNNSFYEKFKCLSFEDHLDLFACFISFNFNVREAYEYLRNKNKIISENLIGRFFIYMREIIYKYYTIVYKTENLGIENGNKYYSMDESLFCKALNGEQLWVIGATENDTRNFMVVVAKDRDESTMKKFCNRLIPKGNNIVTDGWASYDWIDDLNSGYRRFRHVHGRHDFGFGLQSTSHVKSIWTELKLNIKSIYKSIPSKNFLYFLRESEWKLKTKNLSFKEKLDDFFEMINLINIVGEDTFLDDDFLNNEYLNNFNFYINFDN